MKAFFLPFLTCLLLLGQTSAQVSWVSPQPSHINAIWAHWESPDRYVRHNSRVLEKMNLKTQQSKLIEVPDSFFRGENHPFHFKLRGPDQYYLIGQYDRRSIVFSHDGGVSWQRFPRYFTELQFSGSDSIWGLDKTGLWLSTNEGLNWQHVIADSNISSFQILFPKGIVIQREATELYFWNHGTEKQLAKTDTFDYRSSRAISGYKFFNSQRGFIHTRDSIFRTLDGGRTYHSIHVADRYSFVALAPETLVVQRFDSLKITRNGGKDWSTTYAPGHIAGTGFNFVSHIDPNRFVSKINVRESRKEICYPAITRRDFKDLVALDQENFLISTRYSDSVFFYNSGTATLTGKPTGTDGFTAKNLRSGDGQLFLYTDQFLYNSLDDGQTWERIYLGGSSVEEIRDMDIYDRDNIYVIFQNQPLTFQEPYLMKSTDGGHSWTSFGPELTTDYPWSISVVGKDSLLVSGEGGVYLVSPRNEVLIRKGSSWVPRVFAKNKILLTHYSDGALYSNDGGKSFTLLPNSQGAKVPAFNTGYGFALYRGNSSKVTLYNWSGLNPKPYATRELPLFVEHAEFINSHQLLVATGISQVYTISFVEEPIDPQPVSAPDFLPVFPNPNQGSFSVLVPEAFDGAEMHIYSLSDGSLVQRLKEPANTGKQEVTVHNLSPGIYQVVLIKAGNSIGGKLQIEQ